MFGRRILLIVVAPLVVSGCASMSAEECQVGDWFAVGYTDGVRGIPSSRFSEYRKDCAAHGVAPDLVAYRAGRDEGLQEFCQPDRAFELGSRGGSNPGVCPESSRDEFAVAWQTGRQLFELRSAVQEVQRRIDRGHQQLADLEAQSSELEAHLVSSEPSMEERLQLLLDLKNLSEEKKRLEDELATLQEEHAWHQERLAAYEVTLFQTS